MADSEAMVSHFLRKLRHGARLSETDEALLTSLAQPVRHVNARRNIVAEGSEPRWLPLITKGWACRYQLLENGKRQIISLFVPGDLCEPFGALPQFVNTSVEALTPVLVTPLSPVDLKKAASVSPAIDDALWWDLMAATAVEREHIVGLGRRSASERLGHLICELHLRLAMVGLVDQGGFDMPVTQTDLSDLLGLSAVHVNRSLQELRRTGFLSLINRRVIIHDLEGLRELSLFEGSYLHPTIGSHDALSPRRTLLQPAPGRLDDRT